MNVHSRQSAQHLLYTYIDLTFHFAHIFLFDLLRSQERSGQHHVDKLIRNRVNYRLWRPSGLGTVDSEIHVFYLLGNFKLISESLRSGPNEQIGCSSRLDGFDENLVRLSLNLKIRAASGRHCDRLMKLDNCEMVQSSCHSDHRTRTGTVGSLTGSKGAEGREESERNQASHISFLWL